MLLERASGTIVERGNAVEPQCFSERTEKVISIGLARGEGAVRKRKEEGETEIRGRGER